MQWQAIQITQELQEGFFLWNRDWLIRYNISRKDVLFRFITHHSGK